jgi:Fe2+/Zn2+ uptake regulation proteins
MNIVHDMGMATDNIRELLLRHEVRPTAQRVEIAQVLLCEPQHLSADQVLSIVNKHRALVSKATVYNTLHLFAAKGLIRKVIIDPDKVFFDSNTNVHHHLYNEDTGMLQDIDAAELIIKDLPRLPAGTFNAGIDIIIRVRNKA